MSTADVVPLGDLRRHLVPGGYADDVDATEGWLTLERNVAGPTTCWCEPILEPVFGPGDEIDAIVIHRAADGREREETA